LPNATFESDDSEAKAQFDALAKELQQPFVFSLADGKLSEVRLQPGWSLFAASIARTIAAALQFSEQPTEKAGDVWTAEEFDATGTYSAEYRRTKNRADITKRKLSYKDVALGKLGFAQFNAKLTPQILSSKGVVAFANPSVDSQPNDRRPRALTLQRVEYQEKLQTNLTPTSPVISETSLKLAFSRVEKRAPPFDWQATIASTRRMSPTERYGTPSPVSSYDSERVGSYTFETALQELEQHARKSRTSGATQGNREPEAREEREASIGEHGRVFTAMAALLRSEPKHIKSAVKHVRHGSPAKRALLDALSSAGTTEAQEALVAIMEDRKLDKPVRLAAAFSLTRTTRATPASVSALEKHVNDGLLRVHALYGLGTISRRLRDAGEAERAEAIVLALIDALRTAKTPAARVHVLRGVANSGAASALESVRPFLSDKSAKLRAAAIDAIRLMKHPDVDVMIANRLSTDESLVQTAALDAIAVREPSSTLVDALRGAATTAQRAEARIKAVRIMGQWLAKYPALQATLKHVAEKDERDAVRSAAKSALGS
jgi:cytochrome c556